jgi:hypothetical protein
LQEAEKEIIAQAQVIADTLVPVNELADALGQDRCVCIRRLRKMGFNTLRVIDSRAGYNKWKLALTPEDAARFVAEMKRIGYGPQAKRSFMDKGAIAAMVEEQK